MMRYYWLIILILSMKSLSATGQENNEKYSQLWANFMVFKTYENSFRYLAEFGPRVLLSEANGWSQLELSQNVQYNVFWNVDAIGGLLLNYTVQSDTTDLFNSYEVRPWLGFRIHFNPNSKLMVSFFSRIEFRNLFYSNTKTDQHSTRLRNRLEATYSINRPNFYHDKLWYLTLDGEYYYPITANPDERFANAARIRLGVGYRHNFNWRYVVVFMEQFSRNTINEEFKSSNFIVDLRVHFFIPAKEKKN